MNRCPVCRSGELQEASVETWMRKADQWVLLTHVPAMKCDVCGETTFSQGIAERMADIVATDSVISATGSRWSPEYNLEKLMSTSMPQGTPKVGASTGG